MSSEHTHRYSVFMAKRQKEALQKISLQTDLSQAEILRRVIDYGLTYTNLNHIIPTMSGSACLHVPR